MLCVQVQGVMDCRCAHGPARSLVDLHFIYMYMRHSVHLSLFLYKAHCIHDMTHTIIQTRCFTRIVPGMHASHLNPPSHTLHAFHRHTHWVHFGAHLRFSFPWHTHTWLTCMCVHYVTHLHTHSGGAVNEFSYQDFFFLAWLRVCECAF